MDRIRERGGKATCILFGSPHAAGHHSPAFDWREDTILVGVGALVRTSHHLWAIGEAR